jgi:hypothetical protein
MGIRDVVLGARDLRTATVEVPEWDATIALREWDGATRDRFDSLALEARERGAKMPRQLRAWIVAMSVIDESGQLAFSESDIDALSRKSARALDRIVEAALQLNALTQEAAAEAGKG